MKTLDDMLREYERSLIVCALRRCGGVRSEAARALGIRRGRLYDRMRTLGVEVPTAAMEGARR